MPSSGRKTENVHPSSALRSCDLGYYGPSRRSGVSISASMLGVVAVVALAFGGWMLKVHGDVSSLKTEVDNTKTVMSRIEGKLDRLLSRPQHGGGGGGGQK